MENKMYAKPQYKCAICGTVYDDLRERVNCESVCLHKQEEEAKKAAELKKKEEKAARKAEVDAAFDKAMQLREAYLKDYDTYIYTYNNVSNSKEDDNWLNLKSLWHCLY